MKWTISKKARKCQGRNHTMPVGTRYAVDENGVVWCRDHWRAAEHDDRWEAEERKRDRRKEPIDRDLCLKLAADIEAALDDVALKHGLTVKVGGGRFDANSFRPKVEFLTISTTVSRTGVNGTKKEEASLALASMYGLKPEWAGKPFTVRGETYRLVGIEARRQKNCCMIERVKDGKRMVCPPTFVQAGFGQKPDGKCQNTHKLDTKTLKVVKCTAKATTHRRGTALCAECEREWAEAEAEARWEAKVS